MSVDRHCRKCNETLSEKNGAISCRNGCDVFTAVPQGGSYRTPVYTETDSTGRVWSGGGVTGVRRMPTNRE